MARNKKRKKVQSSQAARQLNAAQHKNAVMEDLSYLCYLIGGTDLFKILPQKYKDAIYNSRGTMRIVSGSRKKIQKRLAEVMAKELREEMYNRNIEVIEGGGRLISLYDFLLVGVPLYLILNDKKCFFSGKERFECFYKDNKNMRDELIREIEKLIPIYCDFYSDIKRRVVYDFWTETKLHYDLPGANVARRFTLNIVIEPIELVTKSIRINHETHIGTQILYIRQRPDRKPASPDEKHSLAYQMTVRHKLLDPKSSFPELHVDVYIQNHALDRLSERSSCPFPHWIRAYLVDAFMNPVITKMTENKFLIEYRMVGIKIGYLLATLVDGDLLIRTFLFITHNGTPEGKNLEKATGLKKEDKKYLLMDNIRTLANSDIDQNPEMQKIFLQAGLGSLLELCRRVRERDKDFNWLISESENKTSLSRLIIEYMKPGADNDEFIEVEDS
ncbi:MAG: hypothetical protein LBJ17_05950 [Dysgonamonadaceae bacterium]|jgi:hypothetical protein|nr:hypothetical protein [Dysgonamonadaceae bacterium]